MTSKPNGISGREPRPKTRMFIRCGKAPGSTGTGLLYSYIGAKTITAPFSSAAGLAWHSLAVCERPTSAHSSGMESSRYALLIHDRPAASPRLRSQGRFAQRSTGSEPPRAHQRRLICTARRCSCSNPDAACAAMIARACEMRDDTCWGWEFDTVHASSLRVLASLLSCKHRIA